MNKKIFFAISCLVVTLSIFSYTSRRNGNIPKNSKKNITNNQTKLLAPTQTKINKTLLKDISSKSISKKDLPKRQIKSDKELSAQCFQFYENITFLSVNDLQNKLKNNDFEIQAECDFELKKHINIDHLKDIYKKCYQSKNIQDSDQNECFQGLLLYRAKIINYLTLGQNNRDLEAPILISKLFANFFDTNFSQEKIKENIELLDIIIEKEPELYGAYKTKLIHEFILSTKDQNHNSEKIEELIRICEERNNNDLEIFRMKFYTAFMKDDHNLFQKYALEHQEKYPHSGESFYNLSSFSERKLNNRKLALNYMKQALEKEPNNLDYLKAYKILKKTKNEDKTPVGTFQFRMNLNLDF